MSSDICSVGVLTSGGDSPGMNAAIRAVVRACTNYDLRVMGIRKGYQGLVHGDIFELTARDVSDTLQQGGTVLQTARCLEFLQTEVVKKGVDVAKYFGIDALVVIGGDGSFNGASAIAKAGLPVIGIPGTIDNDIPYTEYTIGFDTAVNTAMEAVDKIRDTASSHERCNIIEVMGRNSGNIATRVAIATGAEAVIVPEKEFDFDKDVLSTVFAGKKRGKRHFILILAEGVGGAHEMAKKIYKKTDIESKVTTLGYLQRGGSPTAMDRFTASEMGVEAVRLITEGIYNRLIGKKDGKVYHIDIDEGLSMCKAYDESLINLIGILSL